MKLNEVRAFVAVARTGSMQAAAVQLRLTQSAVSRLVQRLEENLSVTLFVRQAKPLTLSGDGRIALSHGLRLIEAAEAFSDALAPGTASGVLRIGTAHALAGLLAELPLDRLRASFPMVMPQISVGWTKPLIAQVATGHLDAAIVAVLSEGSPTDDLPVRLLGSDAVQIVGSARYDARAFRSIRAMNAVGWIIQPEGCGYRSALTAALDRIGAGAPRVVVEAFGIDVQIAIVARGTAFALLPARQVALIPARRKVRVFAANDFKAKLSTWIVRRSQLGRLSQPLDIVEHALSEIIA